MLFTRSYSAVSIAELKVYPVAGFSLTVPAPGHGCLFFFLSFLSWELDKWSVNIDYLVYIKYVREPRVPYNARPFCFSSSP